MKKLNLLTIILIIAVSINHGQNIATSAHDFSGESWSNGQVCLPCHTPHNANTSVDHAPLWNHGVTTATYTLYSHATATLDATLGQPAGISKLCLSCHDGTVALDSFDGATGSTSITGEFAIGTDLSNDHPVSFTYDNTLATTDGELFQPGSTPTVAAMLFGGQMECASCHDVHNGSGNDKLLVIDNAGSDLCLTCHNK